MDASITGTGDALPEGGSDAGGAVAAGSVGAGEGWAVASSLDADGVADTRVALGATLGTAEGLAPGLPADVPDGCSGEAPGPPSPGTGEPAASGSVVPAGAGVAEGAISAGMDTTYTLPPVPGSRVPWSTTTSWGCDGDFRTLRGFAAIVIRCRTEPSMGAQSGRTLEAQT